MKKFFSIVKKDALLMIRDWPGLAVLFIMPAVLLVIITLIQESAITGKRSGLKIGLVNADSSVFGENVVSDLQGTGFFNFLVLDNEEDARAAILKSKCQMAVIIPDSSTEKLYNFMYDTGSVSPLVSDNENLAGVRFLYDPSIQKIFRDAVSMPVNALIQLSAIKSMMIKYSSDVNEAVSEHTRELNEILTGEEIFMDMPDFPYRNEVINRFRAGVEAKTAKSLKPEIPEITHFRLAPVGFKEAPARQNYKRFRPNPLQNSIPAFTLFAMFFIVIPLAGSIINEKSHGTFDRMRILPVSIISIISARILLFIAVCFLQFVFLMIIGKYLMPLFGDLSSISMNVNVPALIAAFISSSLAAIGFGIAVGTFSTTHGQAATFGSVMVVILALLGGIFVPIHMLPATIISVSLVSPLRWGTDAFLGVFSQLEDLRGIWKEVCLLFSFFLLSLILSVAHFRKQ